MQDTRKPFDVTTMDDTTGLTELMQSIQSRKPNDPINPNHYRDHPSGVECIEIVEHMSFSLGNAVKYIWRAGQKGDIIEDLKKASWYLDREIARLQRTK